MLFGFEGTGGQIWGGTSSWGVNDLSNTSSFVWRFTQLSTENSSVVKYYPGPNTQGSNCDDILRLAKDDYRDLKKRGLVNDSTKINLVGYSRGAYMAMCFAKFLEINFVKVNFLAMFDAVSRDSSVEDIIATRAVPMNVQNCYHAARSPKIGSRNITMDRAGQYWENGTILSTRKEYPGSHAAMGGFPNQAGVGDSPTMGQGDPNHMDRFHPQKEITAWWEVANYISQAALRHGVISKSLLGATKPNGWIPESEWYKAHAMPNLQNYQVPYYGSKA